MKFLSYDELKPAKGIVYSRSALLLLEKAGKFPKRVPVSGGRVAWVESEIDEWQKQRIEARDAAA